MNHILDKKMIKGKILIIILGIKILVSISGMKMLTFIFLKTLFLQINLILLQNNKTREQKQEMFLKN